MNPIENMNIAGVELTQDQWNILEENGIDEVQKHATFQHNEVCEFILYLSPEHIEDYRKVYPPFLIIICVEASKLGYDYINFYA